MKTEIEAVVHSLKGLAIAYINITVSYINNMNLSEAPLLTNLFYYFCLDKTIIKNYNNNIV